MILKGKKRCRSIRRTD